MDNKENRSFMDDADDFMECTCRKERDNFDFEGDNFDFEGDVLFNDDSMPFVNDDLSNFDDIELEELTDDESVQSFGWSGSEDWDDSERRIDDCGCSESERWDDEKENNDSCECNDGFDDFIGEVEVNKGHCGKHEDPCCEHGACSNEACFKQEGNCEDDCFKERKPEPKEACLKVKKFVNRSEAFDGETLRYCIKIENIGNTTAFNIRLRDMLPNGLTFVRGSLKVSGCRRCHRGTLDNLSLGSLEPCGIITITFEARIECGTSGALRNRAEVTFCFATSRCGDIKCNCVKSNEVVTNVMTSPVSIVKTVDRNVVSVGGELVYRIRVTNNGAMRIDDFTVQDNLPAVLCCREIRVGTTTHSCNRAASGINIGSLDPGETKDVFIRARVQDFPANGTIRNSATGRFFRNGQELCPVVSNTVSVTVILFMCKPAKVTDKVRVSCANGPVHTVTNAVANVKVLDVKEEKPGCGCGDERFKRIRVSGIINLCIKYDTCSGCEKTIIRKIPFCLTIKVPRSFVLNKNFCITVEPKEICTKICCGFEIATTINLLVCLSSI